MDTDDTFKTLWVEKYRPKVLKDLIIDAETRRYLESFRSQGEIPHLLFHGCPGIGKSTLARILVRDVLDAEYLYINASDESGVDTIRGKIIDFAETAAFNGKLKVVILDEADGLSGASSGTAGRTSAQQALRNVMERYANNCRFILTCNYYTKIDAAIKSRCHSVELSLPIADVVARAVFILKSEGIKIAPGQGKDLTALIQKRYPDLRSIINGLQQFSTTGSLVITEDPKKANFATRLLGSLQSGTPIQDVRQLWITDPTEFGNDYRSLLRDVFEAVYQASIPDTKKRPALVQVSEGLYRHAFVMDVEINFFSTMIQLTETLNS